MAAPLQLTPLRTAAILASVALVGLALGLLNGAPLPREAPTAAPGRDIAVRDVRLTLPDGWSMKDGGPLRDLGLPGARELAGSFTDVVVAQALPAGRSLLPAGLLPAGASPPVPSRVTARGLVAWSYALTLPGRPDRQADVRVVPTTAGVVVLACLGPPSGLRTGDCDAGLRHLRLARGRALKPGPDAAFLSALPGAVARLSSARRAARAGLAVASTPAARARAAQRLAGAYGATARALRPLVAGVTAASATVALLDRLRDQHGLLARATAAQYGAGTAAALAEIRTTERVLASRLAAWRRLMASR